MGEALTPAAFVSLAVALGVFAVLWLLVRRARRPRGPYPFVLVHGMFGFDSVEVLGRRHDYFRGIAEALTRRGEQLHQVRLPPVASVAERARILSSYVEALDAAQVNLIAHSMGGIDARYAISKLGLAGRVASLVTIGSPHHGTPLADLARTAPGRVVRSVLETVGIAAGGAENLTPASMERFNQEIRDADGVYYASVVARCRGAQTSLALKTSRHLLSRRAGTSDGVVPSTSQVWGEVILETNADHWAQIGWSKDFDARPMYEHIVDHLRARGL